MLNPLLRCAAANLRHRDSRARSRFPSAIACLLVCKGGTLMGFGYQMKMASTVYRTHAGK